jgi:predicted lactoylglutathione lyase
MHSDFPAAVPEIPVSDINKAAEYYVKNLGFKIDWGGEDGGIAGISKGSCRMFLTNSSFRQSWGNVGPVMIWLNLNSKSEVNELYEQWKMTHATIVSEPDEKPWKLLEFTATDLDGNLFRVFYDFSRDKP